MGLDQRLQDKEGNVLWVGRSFQKIHDVISLISERGDFANGVCSVIITPEKARFITEFGRHFPDCMPQDFNNSTALECALAFGDDLRYIATW